MRALEYFRRWSVAAAVAAVVAAAASLGTSVVLAAPAGAAPCATGRGRAAPCGAGVVGPVRYYSQGIAMTIDPATGTVTYRGSSATYGTLGAAISSRAVAAGTANLWKGIREAASYACYTQTELNSNFKAYTPWHSARSGTSFSFDWLNQLYAIAYARRLYGSSGSAYWTYQIQYCTSGGGQVFNGYHMNFAGNAIMWEATANNDNAKIGWKWPSGTSGNPTSSLSFVVSYGPVSIGSTSQAPGGGTFTGDLGNDGRFPGIMVPDSWQVDRANTYWVSPANWPWDGTEGFAGNTAQVLFEWPMGTHIGTFYSYADLQAFCAWGGCPAL